MDNHNYRLDFDSSCDSLDFDIRQDGEQMIDLQDGEVFSNDARRDSESNNASVSSLRSLSASAKSLSWSARNLVSHNDVRNRDKRSIVSRSPPSSMRNLRNSGSEEEFSSPRPSSDRRRNIWNVGPDQLFGKKETKNIGGDFYFDLSYLNE
jgi:hypothetical protein